MINLKLKLFKMRWHIPRNLLMCIYLLLITGALSAQDAPTPIPPAPTLTPPTLVPALDAGAEEGVVSQSGVARIIESGRVRVGILYNEPPFGELNVRGELSGFDADLAAAIAETWGVDLRLKQVTRQTAQSMLMGGEVDLLIAAQVHRRELATQYEFSQTYHLGSQSVMVRAGDGGIKTLPELVNKRIGVTLGTPSEAALAAWSQRSGVAVTAVPFPLFERGYAALMAGEIDGIVGSRYALARIASQPDTILIIDTPLELEPYAIAMPPQDVNLRNLVNQTLQYLRIEGTLTDLRGQYFPESSYLPSVWAALPDSAPQPDQFNSVVTYPAQYVVPRLQTERVLRVALPRLPEGDAQTDSLRRLDTFYRGLVDEIGRRWQVRVEYVLVETPTQGLEAVANGQADFAVGVQANWEWDERVDFSGPYLLRGLRLLLKQNSNTFGFEELRGGRYVAYPIEQPELQALAIATAEEFNAVIRTYGAREQDLAHAIVDENNADAAFADSIALLPFIEQYANQT
ncbi:MAG: transporter substrate-binding domain-containing protein, partial [Armatimonadetes bacterium]|nr:transporter substrate-binding domain-containing protein [Anaerolineae bacterium]